MDERDAVKKGQRSERLVVNAMNSQWKAPDWFLGCHIASEKQDHDGIDILIQTTDVGELFLQVKSSDHGRRAFMLKEFEQGRDRPLAIVVVQLHDSKWDIRRKVLREIVHLRGTLLRRRARESTPIAS